MFVFIDVGEQTLKTSVISAAYTPASGTVSLE
jgi:hypothetical protein